MLNNDDRRAIEGLFSRLKDVERKSEPRDPEAEALIRQEIARQPGAPYYMAQTILVQEQALEAAQQKIAGLEASANRRDVGRYGRDRDDERGPWERQNRVGGGGFLAGAMQTALGVTGGVLLGSAIAGMFGAGSANAAEPAPAEPDAGNDTDLGNDDLGGDAGDFGDGGGFDGGGGFDFGGDF